ncbi:AP-1-like transcription factor [Cytospora mali]|nr:AP-1-like transcription factor [Valsa mali var. pyri (nom. inval.)]
MEKDSGRQTSAELRTNKRKGTRSVSTLTPSQLARKRANDREAQRAIRARTKEHIERLECELEELKSKQNRDETVQDLLKRNKALECELKRLRKTMGIPHTDPYPSSVYENELPSLPSSGVPSLSSSYGQSVRASADGYGYSHIPTPEPSEPWTTSIPVTVPSAVSSPSSSGPMEEYGYIPPSLPALIDGITVPATAVPYQNEVEYEDGVDSGENDSNAALRYPPVTTNCGSQPDTYLIEQGFPKPSSNHVAMTNSYPIHHQPQQWGSMYGVYYPQSPSL